MPKISLKVTQNYSLTQYIFTEINFAAQFLLSRHTHLYYHHVRLPRYAVYPGIADRPGRHKNHGNCRLSRSANDTGKRSAASREHKNIVPSAFVVSRAAHDFPVNGSYPS